MIFSPSLYSKGLVLMLLISCCTTFLGCSDKNNSGPAEVKVVKNGAQYSLTVNGQPFTVKGVGLGYKNDQQIKALKAAGGNSFRTWDLKHIEQELAMAKKLDLMVAVGIRTGKELTGFDYNDQAAVAKQFERVKAAINQYKDHPNILIWVINNEPNLLFDENEKLVEVNPKVYSAMGDIIDYIHQVDPNHPVTFSLAGANPRHIQQVVEHAPNIDIIAVQTYGDLVTLPEAMAKSKVDKPFMVTEFGPMGHWELPTTNWGREIEEPSAVKAAGMAKRMQDVILNDKTGKIIGSFAFFWGQKQERTPTWYGMFNETGEQTARIDELTRLWTGQYPANRAPLSSEIRINGQLATQSLRLAANQIAQVKVLVSDPDQDPIRHEWVLMREVTKRSQGGHFEAKPAEIPIKIITTNVQDKWIEMTFKVPPKPGEYRLFNYAYDGKNKVGNANFPFLVE
ncbi:glycoside hydrolase family 2 TIM barrel-domain containing protein [Paraglaciecola aestuariivivens]